jgi:FtsP/CotA-like multicopper oxidase with cupredoxin domain
VTSERRRLLLALLAAAAVVAPLGWMWQASLVPDTYNVMDMGVVEQGRDVQPVAHAHGEGATSVEQLVADPARPADVRVELVAREERFTLPSGQEVDGYTLNGMSPGPELRVQQGQLLEVRLVNESVEEGATLHWHGVDVPNAVDGVAGVTQDAVPVGGEHVYRFVAEQAGTFWYHSHQVSHEQVRQGLLGALVVEPAEPLGEEAIALLHVYDGTSTVNGRTGDVEVDVPDGTPVRVRVVNTDNGAASVWSPRPFRVLAVDGTEVHEPTEVRGQVVRLTAGGRVDVEVVAPARVQLGRATSVVVGEGADAVDRPRDELDLLAYGTPAPLGFDPDAADRRFEYAVGRRPGFLDGRPGMWWSVNGRLFPDVPMYVVEQGDVVRMTVSNTSGEAHPMHLHGHHAVVVSRNGDPATGSPWVVDSLDVAHDETYELAFVADNPGLWMDHCHNLPHAADGLIAHLAYEGVRTPYLVGGEAANRPE